MKTVEITEIDLNQLVNQTTIDDEIILVDHGRQIARLLPPHPPSQSAKRPIDEFVATSDQPPTFFVAEEGDAMDAEIAAYEALHEELVEKYLGQFVAIHQGSVVDHDPDRLALRQRLSATYPDVIVLVRQVKPALPGPLYIRSPQIQRTL